MRHRIECSRTLLWAGLASGPCEILHWLRDDIRAGLLSLGSNPLHPGLWSKGSYWTSVGLGFSFQWMKKGTAKLMCGDISEAWRSRSHTQKKHHRLTGKCSMHPPPQAYQTGINLTSWLHLFNDVAAAISAVTDPGAVSCWRRTSLPVTCCMLTRMSSKQMQPAQQIWVWKARGVYCIGRQVPVNAMFF